MISLRKSNHDICGGNATCEIFGKSFGKKFMLNRHLNGVHFKKSNFSCNLCGFKISYRNRLNTHSGTKHNSVSKEGSVHR